MDVDEDIYRVVGNFPSRFGLPHWHPGDNTGLLSPSYERGVLWAVLRDLPCGTYEFKITLNGSWATNFGQDGSLNGENMIFSVANSSTRIRFRFELSGRCCFVLQDQWSSIEHEQHRGTISYDFASSDRTLKASQMALGQIVIVQKIMSFLDVISLCRVACVSRLFQYCANDDVLWRPLARHYFEELREKIVDSEWKSSFRRKALEPCTSFRDLLIHHELRHCRWYSCPNVRTMSIHLRLGPSVCDRRMPTPNGTVLDEC